MTNQANPNGRSKKIVIVVGLIIASYFLILGVVAKILLFPDLSPATPTIFCCVDGAAQADVLVWLDQNGNGVVDQGEPPLSDFAVIIIDSHFSYPSKEDFQKIHFSPFEGSGITDSEGKAFPWIFKPGCAKDCSKGYSVAVEVPPNYKPTTPVLYELDDSINTYKFGFQFIGFQP